MIISKKTAAYSRISVKLLLDKKATSGRFYLMNPMNKRTGDNDLKPVCFICGTGRQRNLMQIYLKGWPVPARSARLYCCIRCLLGGSLPNQKAKRRYTGGDQVAKVLQWKAINPIHQRYCVGSSEWLELDVSIFD